MDTTGPPVRLNNRYRLVEWIGESKTGTVYRAHDDVLDCDVIVRFLLQAHFTGAEAKTCFLHTARAVSQFSHPNIVTVYDAGTERGWHYLVQEYILGQTLDKIAEARSGPFPIQEALSITHSVLEALTCTHARGIIHGDIKPENLWLTPEGIVKVADFGVTTKQDAPPNIYTDLCAVGSMLANLLSGHMPLPADVEHVIDKLRAANPDERYPSADAALAALTNPNTTPATVPTDTLAMYAALNDVASAIEAERHRLATLLQHDVLTSLELLLTQTKTYEQFLSTDPHTRTAFSILTNLSRQLIQQVQDLENDLHPTTLEKLGLEPAIERLADQATRVHGIHIHLNVQRLPQRPAASVELALFRAAQYELDNAIRNAHATQIAIALAQQMDVLTFSLSHNGASTSRWRTHAEIHQRVQQLGGNVESSINAQKQFEITYQIILETPVTLTAREMDVIRLLAEGLSNKEIAGRLSISARTVNYHLDNIYSKLGVNSRTEAAIYALRHGWVQHPG